MYDAVQPTEPFTSFGKYLVSCVIGGDIQLYRNTAHGAHDFSQCFPGCWHIDPDYGCAVTGPHMADRFTDSSGGTGYYNDFGSLRGGPIGRTRTGGGRYRWGCASD